MKAPVGILSRALAERGFKVKRHEPWRYMPGYGMFFTYVTDGPYTFAATASASTGQWTVEILKGVRTFHVPHPKMNPAFWKDGCNDSR